jgi:hypothetical protein
LTLSPPNIATPYSGSIYAYDPNLRLPYSFQYNLAVEQALSRHDSITVGYVGSGARKLLTTFIDYPGEIGNPNFALNALVELTQGRASSSYNSLQAKYQTAFVHGLQALVSYTYSHSIDNASSNFGIYYLLRASSDFDIRHNLQAAVTYLIPPTTSQLKKALVLNDWGLDFRVQARTALPVDIVGIQDLDPHTGSYLQYQPDLVSGQHLYLYGSQYPGGHVINYSAFQADWFNLIQRSAGIFPCMINFIYSFGPRHSISLIDQCLGPSTTISPTAPLSSVPPTIPRTASGTLTPCIRPEGHGRFRSR